MKRHIPNFVTTLNLVSGLAALLCSINGLPVLASLLILLAMVFDFLDGFVARLLKCGSEMGKELDSLADLVSFGVAPALILYFFLGEQIGLPSPLFAYGETSQMVILFIPLLMPVCAALRLAKFNIDDTQKTTFKGLPTPASALMVVSVILADHYCDGSPIVEFFLGSQLSVIIMTVSLSLLMVCRIPLLSLKVHDLKFSGNEALYLFFALVVIALIILRLEALPLIIPFYFIASLIAIPLRRKSDKR